MVDKGGCKIGKKSDMGGCKIGKKKIDSEKKKKFKVRNPGKPIVVKSKESMEEKPKKKVFKVRNPGKPLVVKPKVEEKPKPKKKKLVLKPKPAPKVVVKPSTSAIIPTTKQSVSDLEQQKLLKQYFKTHEPYGGGHYEVHGGKLYVEQHHYDTDKERIDATEASAYGTDDWKRTIKGKDWGSGDRSTGFHSSEAQYAPLRSLKMGKIGLKKKELLKGFKEYDVYSTRMGHTLIGSDSYPQPRRIEGLKFQKKGEQVFDMFGQKKNVDIPIRALYPVKGETNVFNTFKGKDAKYGIKFRFKEGQGFVEMM